MNLRQTARIPPGGILDKMFGGHLGNPDLLSNDAWITLMAVDCKLQFQEEEGSRRLGAKVLPLCCFSQKEKLEY